ncbi:hypothetical protein PORY_000094 [Pneumocystis oryctolagi]|uniref:Uncharacterized protein n=1 Tax=Pneumocystis oryctolagi TaxID=42067 RepID=A0ACB7CE94_9ASCO|nr:hypothetical protein PORY_000094 [Pneumocystis oryctolagi]
MVKAVITQGKAGKTKKKWSKGKVKDKSNNVVIIDNALCDRIYKDVMYYRMVSVSVLVDRFKINGSLARKALKLLCDQGIIKKVCTHHAQAIYTRATTE